MKNDIKDKGNQQAEKRAQIAAGKKEKATDAWDSVKKKADKSKQALQEKNEDTWGGSYQDKQEKAKQTKTEDAIKNS